MRTAQQWNDVLVKCGVRASTAARWAPVFADECTLDDAETDDFLGQILHESAMLEQVEERLVYTTEGRICAVWPSRFPSAKDATPFVRNPVALANKVYGGRMGNTDPGDGYKYRGRGLLQVTGKDNYHALGIKLGLDLVGNPQLLATPSIALRASVSWWKGNIPDAILGDNVKVTRRVNGGTEGIQQRAALTLLAGKALA